MDNLDLIENYFKGVNSDLQKKLFEKRILEDASFAEEVAFYVSVNGVIQQQRIDEKKGRFRELYEQNKVVSIKPPVNNMWKYMAAAGVIFAVILLSLFLYGDKTSPQQLADKYIAQNWQTLSVTMSSKRDSLQDGLQLFNTKKLTEALIVFEALAKDTSNSEAKKYAGIASVRLQDYDKALQYFSLLEADTALYGNPGKIYKAITLMKRNKPGDRDAAKLLLQQLAAGDDPDGKREAVEWLKEIE